MDQMTKKYTKYFSKWRGVWVAFKTPTTPGQIAELVKYKYQLK